MASEIVSPDSGEKVAVPEAFFFVPELNEDEQLRLTFERAIMAENLEAAMRDPEPADKFDELVGKRVKVHAGWWMRSFIPGTRRPFFGVYDIETEDGNRAVFTCGSVHPLAVLARAIKDDRVPFECRVVEGVARPGQKAPFLFAPVTREGAKPGEESF